MAAGKIKLQKASGGVTTITGVDGAGNTSLVIPESGTVTTNEYVNSNNLGNGSTTFNGFGGSGFKNKLINGNFDIWQRALSQTTSGYASADRWYSTLINSTLSRVGAASGYGTYALAMSANNATNSCIITQPIESFIVNTMKGKTVTLSFNYSSSVLQPTNSLSFSIGKNSVADTSIGTWATIGTIAATTPSTEVQKATLTVTIPNDAMANGVRVAIQTTNIVNGSSVYIYNVQLEEGSVSTPFEQRPIGLELSLCQRYFEVGISQPFTGQINVYDTNAYMGFASFSVSKRIIPTMTSTGSNLLTFYRAYKNGASFKTTSEEAGGCTWTASAEI